MSTSNHTETGNETTQQNILINDNSNIKLTD